MSESRKDSVVKTEKQEWTFPFSEQDWAATPEVVRNFLVSLVGTYHGVSPAHLQGYLNEFVFRFNRRFWPMVGFDSVLKIVAQVESLTYRDFYESGQRLANSAEATEPVLTG